jgi:hypothetical protein
MNSFLLKYVLLEPGKEIMPNRLKLCTCALLPLDLVVILARTIVLVLVHTLARMLVPAKTPALVLTVTHRKFVVSKFRMTDLPGLNPWSRILVWPSPDYQPGEVGLIDECGAAVRSVDQVALLPPAAKLDSATAAAPTLPIVETVSDDGFMLIGDATCATSADTASLITHRPNLWHIRVVKSDVPNATRDLVFGQ